jgi:predicted phosphodiesterase
MTIKRIVLISDLQIPYHDPIATRNLVRFINKWKPHQVATVGDEIDLPQLSKWERGLAGEYAGTLDRDRQITKQILYDLQVTDMVRSNHTDRLWNSIKTRLPAFASLPELKFENWLGLPELGIKFWREPMPIAPNWIAVHGDHTPIKPQGGLSALEAARRHGKNVISGHTHRAGRSAFTEASGGRLGRVLHGVEVGNLMDFRQASYTKGTANWQQAFAIMYVQGSSVQVDIINIEKNGTFIVQGKVYGRVR